MSRLALLVAFVGFPMMAFAIREGTDDYHVFGAPLLDEEAREISGSGYKENHYCNSAFPVKQSCHVLECPIGTEAAVNSVKCPKGPTRYGANNILTGSY